MIKTQIKHRKSFRFKIFRKYRKANIVNDFLKNNEVRAAFFDHWKSIENIDKNILIKTNPSA